MMWIVAKSKHYILYSYLFIFIFSNFTNILHAQIKPPVAETDYLSTYFTQSSSINALENDYANEGDSLIIWGIGGAFFGSATFEDSIIFYSPPTSSFGTRLTDTVYYLIKDITTGQFSEEGKVIVTLERVKSAILHTNNIKAQINGIGNQFRTLNYVNPFGAQGGMEAPGGSGLTTIYNSSLWIGGFDNQGVLFTACERYRTGVLPYSSAKGFDFWNGPVMDSIWYNGEYLNKYNQIWSVSRELIDYHVQNFNQIGYNIPEMIRDWPAHGDTELGIAKNLAPFVDVNKDGNYNPEFGDYPAVRGDQSVYFIFNDDYADHTESFGENLGIEVHGQAWAYACPNDPAFFNTIFIKYEILNRSENNYHDVFLGNYTNFILGFGGDDFIGCDTSLNLMFVYNADDFDDTTSAWYPGYGDNPPAQGVVLLNRGMDHFMFSEFIYPQVDTSFSNDPVSAQSYYNYMNSIWDDSTHLTYGENGHGGSELCNHVFSGDPLSNSGWTHANSGYESGNLHSIASNGPLDFSAGDTLLLELAYIFARDNLGDHLSSLALLKEYAAQIKWFYENDSTPCGATWSELEKYYSADKHLIITPNPAGQWLKISNNKIAEPLKFEVYNLTGKTVKSGILINNQKVNISSLEKGCYIIRIYNLEENLSGKLIKL